MTRNQRVCLSRLFDPLLSGAPGIFLVHGPDRLSYQDLALRAAAYAAALGRRGVAPGDRIGVLIGSCLELPIVLLGHYLAGVVHVPINTSYRDREVAHIVEDAAVRLVVGPPSGPLAEVLDRVAPDIERITVGGTREGSLRFADLVADRVEGPITLSEDRHDEQTALLIYTSGTTGRSKGVALSYRAIVRNIGALTGLWQWSGEDELVLALPLFHVHGLCIGIHGCWLHRMRCRLLARFSPDGVADAVDAGSSIFMGVPTMYRRLLRWLELHPERSIGLRQARLWTSGSAALPAADHQLFEQLTGQRILERYGMSETLLTLSNPYTGARKAGSVGRPVPGCEARLVDEEGQDVPAGVVGEIMVRGDSLLTHYWNRPDATAAAFRAGWFLTGDLARQDEDGYFFIQGRRSVDIIKSGGYKIAAREIEETLEGHPDLAEVAVVGLPDPEWGQRICACVVLTPGTRRERAPLADELVELVKQELASYKQPREVHILDTLPRNALGKLQKHRLIAQLS